MDVNVQAAVEAQLLGINLTGMIAKTTEALVDEGKIKTTVEFLIMPTALEENSGITVERVADEINRMVYKVENNKSDSEVEQEKKEGKKIPEKIRVEDINGAMAVVGMENASLTFTHTFLHYKKVVKRDAAPKSDTAAKEAVDKVVEYAIGLHIEGEKKQSDDFRFLEIREIYINVWNTSDQKVLERMKISTLSQLERK